MNLTPLPSGTAGRRNMALVDTEVASRMAATLPVQTAGTVMETFGISMNTWVKIRKGQPIRASVADRLLVRLRSMEGLLAVAAQVP